MRAFGGRQVGLTDTAVKIVPGPWRHEMQMARMVEPVGQRDAAERGPGDDQLLEQTVHIMIGKRNGIEHGPDCRIRRRVVPRPCRIAMDGGANLYRIIHAQVDQQNQGVPRGMKERGIVGVPYRTAFQGFTERRDDQSRGCGIESRILRRARQTIGHCTGAVSQAHVARGSQRMSSTPALAFSTRAATNRRSERRFR